MDLRRKGSPFTQREERQLGEGKRATGLPFCQSGFSGTEKGEGGLLRRVARKKKEEKFFPYKRKKGGEMSQVTEKVFFPPPFKRTPVSMTERGSLLFGPQPKKEKVFFQRDRDDQR